MSQVLSLRVSDQMAERLERFARRQGNGMTRTKVGVLLLEEALRESEFAFVEFRDSAIGRQPYLKGTGLAVWEMIMIARGYQFHAEKIATDYGYPTEIVQSAVNYYNSYKEEIDQAVEDNEVGFEAMKRLLPNLKSFVVAKDSTAVETQS